MGEVGVDVDGRREGVQRQRNTEKGRGSWLPGARQGERGGGRVPREQRQGAQVEVGPRDCEKAHRKNQTSTQVRHAREVNTEEEGETGREKRRGDDNEAGRPDMPEPAGSPHTPPQDPQMQQTSLHGVPGPEAAVCSEDLDIHATPGSPKCLSSSPCLKGAQIKMG